MKKLATLSLAALLLSSTAVLAQSQATFDSLDSDGDDKLSYTDLTGQWPSLTQEEFDAADIDGDDFLDLSQFEAFQASMGSATSTEVAASGVVTPEADIPLFESLDSDGDEQLAFDDLTGIGVTQEIFDSADIDDNDFLDRTQYESLKGKLLNPDMAADVSVGVVDEPNAVTFESLDSDGDDKLAFSDLTGVGITQEQFDAADIDNDDFLDESQYQALDL
jgi:hypothetical protein